MRRRPARRRAIVVLTDEDVAGLLELDPATRVTSYSVDWRRNRLEICVEAAHLPEVLEGAEPPIMELADVRRAVV